MTSSITVVSSSVSQVIAEVMTLNEGNSILSSLKRAARIIGDEYAEPGDIPWDRLNGTHVRTLIKRMKEDGLAPATINHTLSGIKQMVTALNQQGLMEDRQYRGVMSVKSVKSDGRECGRVITPEEQHKMLAAAASLRDKSIIVLLLWGLRRVEVQRLNVGDITPSDEGIEVAIVGKGLKKRKITIGGHQAEIVWCYCQTREGRRIGSPLFPGHHGDKELKRITTAGISWVFGQVTQRAGVKATTHDCRRTSITEMNEEGITVLDIALYHGHSNPATTMNYVKDDKKRIMSAAATMAARRG